MPNWTRDLPTDSSAVTHRVKRCPAGGRITAIVTANDLLGCNTHYYRGRTQPCEAPNCPACNDGIGWRFHAYLSAVDTNTNEHFIFEFTAQAAEAFDVYRKAHGTLRGCLFEATRQGTKPNGRVIVRTKAADLTARVLPDPPNVQRVLTVLWNIPENAAQAADHHRPFPRISVDQTPQNNNNGRKGTKSPSITP